MQGTVYSFDEDSGAGSVLLDDGVELPFGGTELDESGLRHLRRGQRLTLEVSGGRVVRFRIVGIGPGEVIR
jgi:2-phospho-L-lactate guanylyltransferase